jgi:hypothetical protein
MGVWQGVAMDSPKSHPGSLCLILLCPAGELPLKQPYGRFRSDLAAGRVACGRLVPLWTPHAIRLRQLQISAFLVLVAMVRNYGYDRR